MSGPAFTSPVDIGNRALQHVGAKKITSFTQATKEAAEVAACYDKLRRAELRRNYWRFAIRRVALRALTTTSKYVTFAPWDVSTTWPAASVVSHNGGLWETNVASTGQEPGVVAPWTNYFGPLTADVQVATNTYWAGELLYASSTVYRSLISSNADTPPTANWLTLSGATAALQPIFYPLTAGPTQQTATRNAYRLPNGYLRQAPQEPRAGSFAFLGAPSGRQSRDWEYEGDYIVSSDSKLIIYRFIADIEQVAEFDDMFCEGLACNVAVAVMQPITQALDKKADVEREYKRIMGEARTVNGIETGAQQPSLDEYITCRV